VENFNSKARSSKFHKGELENPGWIAVPEKDLPVRLPYIKNFRPTGTEKAPLATTEKFYRVRCPKCKSWARRETDVSDTFLDSAWYYIGYLLRFENWKLKIGTPQLKRLMRRWLPVDMYIGGAEHAVLHLLYVRFLAMVLYDLGFLHFEEPFKKFRAHGLLIKDGAKMSKSRGNVVNPDEYIKKFGADTLRMYLMFLGPFEQGGDFRDTGIKGVTRFLERVWKFAENTRVKNSQSKNKKLFSQQEIQKKEKLDQLLHKTIKKVTEDIEGLQYNTAISALMILLNEFEKNITIVKKEHIKVFLKLLAPFAPHITEELWHQVSKSPVPVISQAKKMGELRFRTQNSIHFQPWPQYKPQFVRDETVNLVIQVNGRVRDYIEVQGDISEEKAKEVVLARPQVQKWIAGKQIKKIIFVPGKLVNIVTEIF
jgi:leucyl-tRNA synthetase